MRHLNPGQPVLSEHDFDAASRSKDLQYLLPQCLMFVVFYVYFKRTPMLGRKSGVLHAKVLIPFWIRRRI